MSISRANASRRQDSRHSRTADTRAPLPLRRLLLAAALLAAAAGGAHAATISVPAGGDFQQALNQAQPGDTIELAAGATFTGPFTLPDKNTTSTAWITIRTSAPDSSLSPAGQRITPAYAPALPKIVSQGLGEPALRTAPRAHHYRFVGVEFAPATSQALIFDLILLGDNGAAQDTYDEVPHHITLERCYVHAHPTQGLKRGIQLNSAHTDILDSYVAGFKVVGQEAQAIAGFNGPGPYRIVNNYLEAAGENILFGGAQPSLPNLVPSDIEIRRNHFFKPPSWWEHDPNYGGQHWTVKNIFELKNAQRVVIEGNVFENNWVDAQAGFSILFTVRPSDSGPAAVVQDVQFTNNILKNAAQGVNLLSIDDVYCAPERPDCGGPRLRRVTVSNNLFLNIGAFNGRGRWLQVLNGTIDVTVDHNTVFHTESGLTADGVANTNFVFKNNLMRRNDPDGMGVHGSGSSEGIPSLDLFFPSADFRRNLVYGVEQEHLPDGDEDRRQSERRPEGDARRHRLEPRGRRARGLHQRHQGPVRTGGGVARRRGPAQKAAAPAAGAPPQETPRPRAGGGDFRSELVRPEVAPARAGPRTFPPGYTFFTAGPPLTADSSPASPGADSFVAA